MLYQSFSELALKRILRPSDFLQPGSARTIDDFLPVIEKAAKEVQDRTLSFDGIRPSIRRKKTILRVTSQSQQLIIRKLNDTLKRVYKTRQADRGKICRTMGLLMTDPSPYFIVRCDVKSFYESMPTKQLIEAVSWNRLFSPETKWVLDKLFRSQEVQACPGLPRGLAISSTLSEKFMESFDKQVIRTPGVFYYARFVDDILIGSSRFCVG